MARDIPPGNDERAVARVREELQILLGTRGDPLDAALTLRSAIDRGLIDRIGNALGGNVTYVNTFPTTTVGGTDPTPDLTPPHAVAGLLVTAGFSSILVQFTAPTYTQGHGNLRTNIYAVKKDPSDATLPTFSAGVTPLATAAPGTLNIVSIPSELNTRWHVWAKHVTVDGVESTTAAGGTNGYNVAGAYPTTGQDTAQLLGVLAGKITESQLYAALNAPIRSIIGRADDAADNALRAALAGRAAAKRASEALLIEAGNRGTAITETRTLVDTGDAQLAGKITTLTAAVATNQSVALAAVQTEALASVSRDTAEVTLRQSLATKLTGLADPSAATLGSITSGLLYDERTVRSGADSALSTRSDGLEASVNTASTGLLARATALETTTTAAGSGNSALATRSSTLEASVNSPTNANNPTYAALSTEASVRASETGPILASYSVKLDVNGYLSGYGITSSLVAGGTPTSTFLVSVDKFAVATPTTSITNWTASSVIGVNEIRGVAGNTDKVLVCKTPGTTGGSVPAIAGAIGTTLQDGGVSWQIASRVPFAVLTVPTTINGVAVPAGVYIDAAYVLNGTIKNSQLGDAIIDNAKVIDLSASKLLTGSLAVGADISSTGFVAGSSGWRIQGNGNAEFGAAMIRGQLTASQINANGLSIYSAAGALILNAGASLDSQVTAAGIGAVKTDASNAPASILNSNVTITGLGYSGDLNATNGAPVGTSVAGTAAATVASGAANGATALTAVNDGTTGLAQRLRSNAQNVLAGPGGLATGSLTWDSSGNRTGGYGVGMTATGLAAYSAAFGATPTFALGADGNLTLRGTVYASAGEFAGALSAATGTFAGTLTAQSVITTFLIAPNAVSVRRVAQRTTTTSLYFGGDGNYMVYNPVTIVALASMTLDAAVPADVHLSFVFNASIINNSGTPNAGAARVRLTRNGNTIWTSATRFSNSNFSTDDDGGLHLDQAVSGSLVYALVVEGMNMSDSSVGYESYHTVSANGGRLIAIAYQR